MSLGYIAHRQHVRVEAELKRIRMFGEASGQALSASRTATWDRTTSGAPGQQKPLPPLAIAHQNEEVTARGKRALIRAASPMADPHVEAWSLATPPRRYAALFEKPFARAMRPRPPSSISTPTPRSVDEDSPPPAMAPRALLPSTMGSVRAESARRPPPPVGESRHAEQLLGR